MTTISHGTEMSLYRGTAPFATQAFDLELRAFVPREQGTIYPMRLGTEYVGEVIEIGAGVVEVAVGDLVYGRGGHRDIQQAPAAELVRLPDGLEPEAALFVHHGCVALNALHDAKMRLGDSVGVFGLGVIGLLALQMARLSGARRVFGADTFAMRRQLALEYGAEDGVRPAGGDAGLEMKSSVGAGVDVAFEVSGTYPGLQAAIRSVRIGGRIVAVGYYQGGGEALRLGEEFLHNRVDLVSTMYVWDCPHRDYPLWDKAGCRMRCSSCLPAVSSRPSRSSRIASRGRRPTAPIVCSTSTRTRLSGSRSPTTEPGMSSVIRVTVWGENFHEHDDRKPIVREIYPDGMHTTIAEGIVEHAADRAEVRTVTFDEPEHGLPTASSTPRTCWSGGRMPATTQSPTRSRAGSSSACSTAWVSWPFMRRCTRSPSCA